MIITLPAFNLVGLARARRVVVVDGNNIGWRCWHAPNYKRMTFGGKRSGHVFGFTKTLLSFIAKSREPTAVVVAIDGHPKHKYVAVPSYKGNREGSRATGDPMPEITQLAQLLPFYYLHHAAQEADDMIAAFLHRFRRRERKNGRKPATVCVVTSDHDLLALVGPNTVWQPRASEKPTPEGLVAARMRVGPEARRLQPGSFGPQHVSLFKAITGDSSDNIRGVPRIRKKRVAEVIAQCDGSEDAFLALIHAGSPLLSDKERIKLVEQWETVVKINHKLTKLNRSLRAWPVRNSTNQTQLEEFLVRRYGCRSLAGDIRRMFK
jgi:5'-3' exonuclease